MFEGFSFSTPSRRLGDREDGGFLQCDSNLVSPLSSRCPSPGLLSPSSASVSPSSRVDHPRLGGKRRSRSQFRHVSGSGLPSGGPAPAPTSVPLFYVDQQHRLSIGSLTHRLNAHTLENNDDVMALETRMKPDDVEGLSPTSPTLWPKRLSVEPPTPPDTDRDEDIAGAYGPSPTTLTTSPSQKYPINRNSSLPLPQFHISPRPPPRSHPDIRQHRETLSILQSTASTVADTIRLAVLLNDKLDDDHHPSSLPPSRATSRRLPRHYPTRHPPPPTLTTSSSSSSSSTSKLGPTSSRKSRIDKSHYTNGTGSGSTTHHNGSGACGGGSHASLFSGHGQGLRRRSLVLAAVSAVLEAEVEAVNASRRQSSASVSNNNLPSDVHDLHRCSSYALPSRTRVEK